MDDVISRLLQIILHSDFGERNFVWEESDCVTYSGSLGPGKVTGNTAVMSHCRTNRPSYFSIQIPGSTLTGNGVGNNFGAWRCQRCCREVECAMNIGIS